MSNYGNPEKWDVLSYSHETVREVAKQVDTLTEEWIEWRKQVSPNDVKYQHILDLTHNIGLTGSVIDAETEIAILKYLCTAFIYSGVICDTFKNNDNDTALKYNNDNLQSHIKLEMINSISEEINREMEEYTFEDNHRDFAGHRAALRSPGNIPFMKVFTDQEQKYLVCLRRGIELILDDTSSKSVVVEDASHKLVELPHKSYHDGAPRSGYLQGKTLLDIFPSEDFVLNHLVGKTITWIHVTLPSPDYPKTRYEIDFIDREVKSTRGTDSHEGLLNIVGRDRSDWKNEFDKKRTNYVKDYLQEDIIVSFFSDILLSYWIEALQIDGCHSKQICRCNPKGKCTKACVWSELDRYSKNKMTTYVKDIVAES